jgi:hypothetical protein
MKTVEREILFDRFLVAIGVRPSYGEDATPQWEVYCRLVSGSDVVLADECSRDEAVTIMHYKTAEASYGGAAAFIVTEEDCMVDAEFIVRVYVDKHLNEFLCLIEDVTGKSYQIAKGEEATCQTLAHRLARDITLHTGVPTEGGFAHGSTGSTGE